MRDLYSVAADCKHELDAINIKYGNVIDFRVNKRAKSRWGCCKRVPNGYAIEISDRLLQDSTPLASLKNTIIHELLHTCSGCRGHYANWKRLANMVNNTYGYGIKRASSAEDKGVAEEERTMQAKHKFVCCGCGHTEEYFRESKFAKNYQNYICSRCGGDFKKIF